MNVGLLALATISTGVAVVANRRAVARAFGRAVAAGWRAWRNHACVWMLAEWRYRDEMAPAADPVVRVAYALAGGALTGEGDPDALRRGLPAVDRAHFDAGLALARRAGWIAEQEEAGAA